uniref:Ig-like domain-containing protein n=1 Tax=Romanomermis culicivorax TaxID=13658 RepID=A0A915KEW4_ROMCU
DGLNFSPPRNVKLTDDDQILQIFAAEIQNAGFYTCVVENKIGRIEKDFLVRIQGPPKVQKSDLFVEVHENDTITLECPGNGENVRHQWTKSGQPIISHNVHESYDGKKLKITKAQPANGGFYTCLMENQAGKVAVDLSVIVLVPPQVDAASVVEAPVGQYVNISCNANGHPQPKITWSKNGGNVPMNVELFSSGSTSVLQIFSDHESDDIYTCLASNKAGKFGKDILFKKTSRPSLVKFTDQVKVVEGEPVTLKCQIDAGKPYPEVKWLKNLHPISSLVPNAPRNKEHHLLIAKVNLTDSGDYTCLASNKFGHSRVVTKLLVLSPPTIDNIENTVNVIENQSISISCPVKGNPAPVVAWYKNGDKISSARKFGEKYRINDDSLLINHVQVSDNGRYSCEAQNEAGFARSDFLVDVYVKPRFRHPSHQDLLVVEGQRLILNCDFDSNPRAQIIWLKAGRPLNESIENSIRSPMGHRLMVPNVRITDSGTYSCLAKNAAGEKEATFNVIVAVLPKLTRPVDQNPQVIIGQSVSLECPISAVPEAKIIWHKNGEVVEKLRNRLKITDDNTLVINRVEPADQGRYECEASNEAGKFDVEFIMDVLAPPAFKAKTVDYEVVEGRSVTLDCAVNTVLKPSFLWIKSNSSILSGGNVMLSNGGQHLIILKSRASDAGKYICRSTNFAGTTEIQITLKVLIPPKIDLSNVVGNPLAKLNQSVTLECPASGYPVPIIKWYRDRKLIHRTDDRYVLSSNNQTIKLMNVQSADAGIYSCLAENKAGKIEQEYSLEVLLPPVLLKPQESTNITLTEGESLSMTCPISLDGPLPEILWMKDGAQLSVDSVGDLRMSSDNRRLYLRQTKVSDSAVYTCIATNRAGESYLTFQVDVISPPIIDETRNEPYTKAVPGQNVVLWCVATAKPPPSIKWFKDGKELLPNQDSEINISPDRNSLTFASIKTVHNGHYTCIAENPAGRRELGLTVKILLPPSVKLSAPQTSIKLGHSGVLMCEVTGFPEPNVTWSKNGRTLDLLDNSWRLSLPPEIRRSGLKLHIRIAVGQDVTLHCEASGKSIPKLVWYKDGRILSSSTNVEVASVGQFVRVS